MKVLFGLAALFLLTAVIWRFGSRRRSLPCPAWLRWLVELDNPFARTNRAAVIIEHIGLREGMKVLDAGCGPGRLTIPAARAVGATGEVTAMDIQPAMLERVREKARAQGLDNIQFLQAVFGDDRLGHGRFDRALLVTVLGEVPCREAALREIFAALKPGGLLSVTEIIFDPHFQPRSTVSRLAGAAGFSEKAFYGNRLAYTLNFEKPPQS